jgi:hypothetical protein
MLLQLPTNNTPDVVAGSWILSNESVGHGQWMRTQNTTEQQYNKIALPGPKLLCGTDDATAHKLELAINNLALRL